MTNQFCTFRLDRHLLGIHVEHIQEILFHEQSLDVPLAPDGIRGLINLRGQIITAVDLRECLGLASLEESIRVVNLVVRTKIGEMGFLVDAIGDVVEIPGESIVEETPSLSGTITQMIDGVADFEDRLMLVLNPNKVVDWIVARRDKIAPNAS